MSEVRVLDERQDQDVHEWIRLWQRWAEGEPWCHPGFVRAFAADGDRALCAVMEEEAGAVLYPLVQRPLATLPWVDDDDPGCDLSGPYGYGGAFRFGCYHGSALGFWDSFDRWANANDVVTTFSRLSVFPEQLLWQRGDTLERSTNVVRSLDISESDLWMDYDHKVRKNVKRAQASGIEVSIHQDMSDLDEFWQVYQLTMDRRGAGSFYRRDFAFFERLLESLHGHYALCHARRAGEVVSTEIVLLSDTRTYSFLGGTLSAAFEWRPNDLLKHEIIRWSRSAGRTSYLLGGGQEQEDGIFRYKKSFAPRGTVPFSTSQRILNPDSYAKLLSLRRSWLFNSGRPVATSDRWFPQYRSE